jgi:hypothetical protein
MDETSMSKDMEEKTDGGSFWYGYEPPLTVTVVMPDESTQQYIFPEGVRAFAKKYGADAIQVEPDLLMYYHGESKLWKVLEDETDPGESSESPGRGNVASIRRGSGKHLP